MKKLGMILSFVMVFGALAFAANKMSVYNVQPSTGTASYIPTTVGIDKANVKIKSFTINNPSAIEHTVYVWTDVSASTTTATQIAKWTIDASAGMVEPLGTGIFSDEGTYLNLPGFTVTESTTTTPVDVTVMYW